MDFYDISQEDWFFKSIKRYDDLLIYEFQGKVTAAAFRAQDRLIASCSNTNGKNEILELAVPDRLLATKDAGLVKNRDFSMVSAGYLKGEASEVIPYGSSLITSESGGVHVCCIPQPEASDLITHSMCLRNIRNPQICFKSEGETVFSGTNLNDIQGHFLSTGQVSKEFGSHFAKCKDLQKSCVISYLGCQSSDLVTGLRDVGTLLHYDLRSNLCSSNINIKDNNALVWVYSVSVDGLKMGLLNSSGEIFVYDNRHISEPFLKTVVEHKLSEKNGSFLKTHFNQLVNLLSVSGFDKSVQIFSLNSNDNCSPLFIHDGHSSSVNCITGHIWHPSLENVLFSYDSDGTLQAWKFKS